MTAPLFKSNAQMMKFAHSWLWGMSRFVGKNVRSCLAANAKAETAWFPALMECFAFFDFLAGLYVGKEVADVKDVIAYANRFLDTKVYRDDMIEILWIGYRHKIAHQAHPNYVVDTSKDKRITGPDRRIVFRVTDANSKLALKLTKEVKDSLSRPRPMVPWKVPYDHRIAISPLRLQKDLRNSLYGTNGFLSWLEISSEGRKYLVKTILRFYPP